MQWNWIIRILRCRDLVDPNLHQLLDAWCPADLKDLLAKAARYDDVSNLKQSDRYRIELMCNESADRSRPNAEIFDEDPDMVINEHEEQDLYTEDFDLETAADDFESAGDDLDIGSMSFGNQMNDFASSSKSIRTSDLFLF